MNEMINNVRTIAEKQPKSLKAHLPISQSDETKSICFRETTPPRHPQQDFGIKWLTAHFGVRAAHFSLAEVALQAGRIFDGKCFSSMRSREIRTNPLSLSHQLPAAHLHLLRQHTVKSASLAREPIIRKCALNLTSIREAIEKADKIFLQIMSTEIKRGLLCDIPKIYHTDLFVTALFLCKMLKCRTDAGFAEPMHNA